MKNSPTIKANSGLLKVKQLNPSTESNNGTQPYQQNRVYDAEGILPALHSLSEQTKVYLTEPTHKHGDELTYTDAAPTIQSRYGTGGDNVPYVHGSSIRRLTEIECERLQGFPDDWTALGNFDGIIKKISKTQRYKLMGNAVMVDMVQAVASRIRIKPDEL